LKKPDLEKFILVQDVFKGANGLGQTLLSTCEGRITVKDSLTVSNNLAAMAEFFEFDLRTTSQWLDQIKANFPTSDSPNLEKYFWIVSAMISGIYIYRKDYYETISNKLTNSSQEKINEIKINFQQRNEGILKYIHFSISPDHLGDAEYEEYSAKIRTFKGKDIKCAVLLFNEIFSAFVHFLNQENIRIDEMGEQGARQFQHEERGKWSRIPFSVNLAMHYCASQKGATKEGYLDLTELASDLV
jgi:hypothetical protein